MMPLLAMLLLLGPAPSTSAAAAERVCSLAPHFGVRGDSVTLILGRPLPDTVEAGAGGLEYRLEPGHSGGRAVERAIFGQVVEVRRIAGPGADAIAARPEGGRPRVVLVPWDYAADCSRALWARSWRWAEPYLEGLFTVRLRPREHWAGGLPTYDIGAPEFQPYPWGRALGYRIGRGLDGFLTAEKLFEVYMTLPSHAEVHADPDGVLAKVGAWERDNAALVRLYPVPHILDGIRYTASAARAARIVPPMAGTYRLEVRAAGAGPVVLFMRTTARPAGALRAEDGIRPASEEGPAWYGVQVHGAASETAIPATNGEANRSPCRASLLLVEHAPDDAGRWRARLDHGFFDRCLSEETGPAAAAVRSAIASGGPYEADGAFVRDADGGFRFEQTVRARGEVVLEVRGVRVSERVVGQR